jgi:hypothetical protein
MIVLHNSARGGGNRSSLKKTTDLPQVTDKLYHIEITLVLLPINNSQATSHSNKVMKHSEDFDKKNSNVNTWVVL